MGTEAKLVPTGARHEVGVDELFFSTTDARGIIDQANSVFVRLSRHPREELVGAPHNIIRHPVMPGGAFLLMWDTLQAGEPFCAYVDNLAADGSTYGVFATITPLGDDYLSVRARPFVDGLHDAAFSLYGAVRPQELELRDKGWNSHEAAVVGAEKLGELLVGAGIPSYEEFIWKALPAEVEARLEAASGIAKRPLATGDLADMLGVAVRIDEALQEWVRSLDDLQRVADALLAAAPQFSQTMEANAAVADRINENDAEGFFSSAMVYLRVWAQMAPEVAGIVTELLGQLDELRRSCAQTRFRIALAVLHNWTVGQFVVEIIDNVPGSDEARPAIAQLGRALDEGLAETSESSKRNAALAAAAAERISTLRDLLDLPQTMIREWLSRADRSSATFVEMVDTISAQVDRTQADIDLLGSLSDECRRIAVPLDSAVIEEQTEKLRGLLAAHQGHRPRYAMSK
ncbi:MAG: histidine kinase [Actinobacteria bacterium HGW-Actinobacteria-2]|nr:MAG: histidine kinase [Actinobacteria bacterium HGW-Actinobacteria-2]